MYGGNMFERYTEKARRAIFFARFEASQFGSPYIETEHLLLGLLREDKTLTNRFLRSHASVESIRKQIEGHTTIREKVSTSVDLPLSNECKRVLANAAEEAEHLSHKHIGTEHLLLGLLREEKCFAAQILLERGVRLEEVRKELRQISEEQLFREQNPGGSLGEEFQRFVRDRNAHRGFVNEPFLDFDDSQTKRSMQAALARVKSRLGHEYDLVIGGHRLRTDAKIVSINPARPAEVVGVHQRADENHVESAMKAAQTAFATWSRTSAQERAALLFRTANLVRERKFEMCAWLTFEVGKNWAEADADVGETIDFLEFYAREALRLDAATTPIQLPGEHNQLRYIPLGVGAVIPPWNFPLAIMAGMTAAAIVCGNTVILKPSGDAPTIAAVFFSLLEEAGLPDGVVNFCPGAGAKFGSAIVAHPQTRFIAFTGSKAVGLDIHESAAKPQTGQKFIKRTVLEMGGKDSIIVEADCDLDAAVEGVALSAFGFNGQKCSACSRAIVNAAIYDAFCDRLRERVAQMKHGDPAENFYAGPVINETAYKQILEYIAIGKSEGRLLTGGHAIANLDGGYFIAPTVIADVAPGARISLEEIFGPVLAVIKSQDFDDALTIANNTEYGLTGALYSKSRAKLDRAREEFQVGNLYFNRKCTGAMVGAHPFGGFNMSGTDSKAGGPDYLLLFTQAKSIAEKLGTASAAAEEEEKRMGI
jgi:1-pyrroline-5-carboxylate dehydrogenase